MKLILRLVGYSEIINDEKYFYNIYFDANILNFDILKKNFLNCTQIITDEELNNCTVTCNSLNLKKETIVDNTDKIYKLFIFCGSVEIKNKLVLIFKNFGKINHVNQNINDDNQNIDEENNKVNLKDSSEISDNSDNFSIGNLEDNLSDNLSDCLSDNLSDKSNENDIDYDNSLQNIQLEILNDPYFINLIRIYKNKPELFKDFYKYISTTFIIQQKVNKEHNYNNNLDIIKNMNLNYDDNQIMNSLKIANNNVNLALRHLIYNSI